MNTHSGMLNLYLPPLRKFYIAVWKYERVSPISDKAGSAAYRVEPCGSSGFLGSFCAKRYGHTLDFCSDILSLARSILSFTFGFEEKRVKQSGRVPWFRGFSVAGGDAAAVTLHTRLPLLPQRRREILQKKTKSSGPLQKEISVS